MCTVCDTVHTEYQSTLALGVPDRLPQAFYADGWLGLQDRLTLHDCWPATWNIEKWKTHGMTFNTLTVLFLLTATVWLVLSLLNSRVVAFSRLLCPVPISHMNMSGT